MSYLAVGTVLVQSDWLNSALVYGDIALSIKINTKIHKLYIAFKLYTDILFSMLIDTI